VLLPGILVTSSLSFGITPPPFMSLRHGISVTGAKVVVVAGAPGVVVGGAPGVVVAGAPGVVAGAGVVVVA
jgi:hypothetical protein